MAVSHHAQPDAEAQRRTLELVRLGEKSLTLRHHFYREGDPDTVYAVGEVVLVWVDYASGTTVPVPEGIRAAVSPA